MSNSGSAGPQDSEPQNSLSRIVFDSPFHLDVGGLGFVVEPAPRMRVVECDPNYGPFLGGRSPWTTEETQVPVRLTLEPGPATSGLPILFETGETWTAYDLGGEILLRFPAPVGELWLTHLARDLASVTIYCGSPLITARAERTEIRSPLHYPLDQLLTMFALPRHRGILVHAAGVHRRGRGLFLAGPSGAGKTTFMGLLAGRNDIHGLSDDRVIVRSFPDSTQVYGTPWAGEGRVAENRCAELAAVLFLHKSPRFELRPISPQRALRQLLPAASVLWFDRERMDRTLTLCEFLLQQVPAYEFHFRPDPRALDLLDELF